MSAPTSPLSYVSRTARGDQPQAGLVSILPRKAFNTSPIRNPVMRVTVMPTLFARNIRGLLIL